MVEIVLDFQDDIWVLIIPSESMSGFSPTTLLILS